MLDSYNIIYKNYVGHNGREFLFSCPFPDHEDLSPSFSICEKTGVYHCFVCGGGDFIKFIKILEDLKSTKDSFKFIRNKLGLSDNPKASFDYIKNTLNNFKKPKEEEIERVQLKEVELPECESAIKHLSIVKKRVSRKITQKWNMKYCVDGKFNGRLIIPIYFENKLITFAARDMLGRADKWERIKKKIREGKYSKEKIQRLTEKYEFKKILYPFAAPISRIFFNWDNAIKNTEYVIICEGVLDAIRLVEFGYNAIAALSCNINMYRINMLIKHFESIYIALDNDNKIKSKIKNPGQEAAKKIIEKKLKDVKVYNIVPPLGKDPDKCTKKEFDLSFLKSTSYKN